LVDCNRHWGGVWGLLTIPSSNAALILTWLNEHTAAMQAVSAGLLVVLTLALVLLTLAYAIFTNKLRNATDTLATIAGDQTKLLAAAHRAYISVEPRGIGSTLSPSCRGSHELRQRASSGGIV
jgi:hypothetical protein